MGGSIEERGRMYSVRGRGRGRARLGGACSEFIIGLKRTGLIIELAKIRWVDRGVNTGLIGGGCWEHKNFYRYYRKQRDEE